MRQSFILHLDSLEILEEMTLEQKGILFDAIHNFQKGKEVTLDFSMKMAFAPFKNQFLRDDEKYKETVEKRKLAGAKGGTQKQANVASATISNQEVANVADSVNVNVSDSDSESVNESVVVDTPEEKKSDEPEPEQKPEVPDFVKQQQQEFKQEIENSLLLDIEKTKEYLLNDNEVWRMFRQWTNNTEREIFEKVLNEFLKVETGSEGLIYPRPKGKSLFHFQSWTKKRVTDSLKLFQIQQVAPPKKSVAEMTPEEFEVFKKEQNLEQERDFANNARERDRLAGLAEAKRKREADYLLKQKTPTVYPWMQTT